MLKCNVCRGTGKIMKHGKFTVHESGCPSCKSTGNANKPRAVKKLEQCQSILASIAMDDESHFSDIVRRLGTEIHELKEWLAQPQAPTVQEA